jgi:hypothetical protein
MAVDPSQKRALNYGAPTMRFFLEEVPNEEDNDASRVLCFGIPDDCFREDRSYESCIDLSRSENRTIY